MFKTNWRERFWSQIIPQGECRIWTGHTVKHHAMQYGVFSRRGCPADVETGEILVHRIVWVLANGPIPDEAELRHTCDVSLCVEESHLLLGTPQQNVQDKVDRDRQAKGIQVNTAKLLDSEVTEIRLRYHSGRNTKAELAREFHVSHSNLRSIVLGRTWKHLLKEV